MSSDPTDQLPTLIIIGSATFFRIYLKPWGPKIPNYIYFKMIQEKKDVELIWFKLSGPCFFSSQFYGRIEQEQMLVIGYTQYLFILHKVVCPWNLRVIIINYIVFIAAWKNVSEMLFTKHSGIN